MPDVHSLPLNAFYECKKCRCAARQHFRHDVEGVTRWWECRTCRDRRRRFAGSGAPPPECVQNGSFHDLFEFSETRKRTYEGR